MQKYEHAYNAAVMAGKYDLAESIVALWLDSLTETAPVEADQRTLNGPYCSA